MVNINLLPPELKLSRLDAKRNASLISICLVIIIAFVVLGIISRSLSSTVQTTLENSKSDLQKSGTSLDQFSDLKDLALLINDRAKTADEIDKTKIIWSQLLTDLANRVPADMQIETLTGNSAKAPNFVLTGNTVSEREIIKFKDKLEESPFFKNVSFKNSSLNSGQEQTINKLSFTIEFDLEQRMLTQSVSGVIDFPLGGNK